jgi:hypothetical protein
MLDRILLPIARTGLTASAEALFPVNDLGAPDYRTTDLVARMLEYLALLPRKQRTLLLVLFAFVELSPLLLLAGFRRFSRLPVERREALVRRGRSSSVLVVRLLADAVKASTTMMYMSHPAALRYVGVERLP